MLILTKFRLEQEKEQYLTVKSIYKKTIKMKNTNFTIKQPLAPGRCPQFL